MTTQCNFCNGSGIDAGQEVCKPCRGSGIDPLPELERDPAQEARDKFKYLTIDGKSLKKTMGGFRMEITFPNKKTVQIGIDDGSGRVHMMQLNHKDKGLLTSFLGGNDLLRETVKIYEGLNCNSIERMQELNDIISEQEAALIGLLNRKTDKAVREARKLIERTKSRHD